MKIEFCNSISTGLKHRINHMRVGIMQPYFFPYIGYYSLIGHSEKWVVFDTAQFIRHGWIERNRILKPNGGWQYFSVPLVKHSQKTPINEIKIRTSEDWKGKLFRQLEHYKRAPHYVETMQFLEHVLDEKIDTILRLNVHTLEQTCVHLSIPFEYTVFSKAGLTVKPSEHPGQWALHISQAMGAQEYVNPIGGKEVFDADEFKEAGIQLGFLQHQLPAYQQKDQPFEAGLSIIDVLMFNSTAEIKAMQLPAYNIV